MAVPVEQLSVKSTTGLGLVALGSTKAALGDRLGQIINVKTDFGATGDGSTNDQPAIQAALDAAFGSAGSPHGTTNRFLNKPVYFPAGNYKINGPLYLTNVVGGWIFGAGMEATRIFYGGSLSGNTVAPSTFDAASDNIPANQITPIFMTNGLSYSTIEKMTLSITGTKTTSLYLFQDGSQGNTTTNKLSELGIGSGTFGILAGYQSNALCSECTYINVIFGGCGRGLHLDSFNALDHQVFGGGANSCTVAAYSCPAGQINTIQGVSLSGNAIDFLSTSNTPISIIGGRSEGAAAGVCAYVRPGTMYMGGFLFQGVASTTFVDATQGFVVLDACQYAPAAGSGVIVAVGSAGQAIIDGMVANSGVGGTITGSAGSKVYLRGCRLDPSNATAIASYTGTMSNL